MHERRGRRWGVRVEIAGALVAGALVGGAVAGTGVPASAATTAWEAEALVPAARVNDASASGGALARTQLVSVVGGLPAGNYTFVARVKASVTRRVDLEAAGGMVGSFATRTTWQSVNATVHLSGTSDAVAVRSIPLPGKTTAGTVDVDWLSLTPVNPGMTVRGNKILDAAGNPFTPRGVNTSILTWPRKRADGRGFNYETNPNVEMYIWGANTVRIQLNQEHWIGNCPGVQNNEDTTYRAVVDKLVAQLSWMGIVSMLDLHVSERGKATGCAEARAPGNKEMADLRALTFWSSVAATYKDNPLVVFDLYNEPHNITDSVWRNGGSVTYNSDGKTYSYTATGMQKMLEAIRGAGAQNVVFVSGVRWASDPGIMLTLPLNGNGIVGAKHVYCTECPANDPHVKSGDISVLSNTKLTNRFPVTVTEFGWGQTQDPRYNRAVINLAESKNVGWLAHNYYRPGAYSLLNEWLPGTFPAGQGENTLRPSADGVPVWNSLAPVRTARGYNAAPLPE